MEDPEWSKEAVLQFLDYYREEPIIWKATHPNHKIRNDVYDAWKRIEVLMDGQFTVNELKKKKESLMASFRTCVTKVRSSKRSGAGTDNVYKPIWFAFDKMATFLMNKDGPRGSINSEDIMSQLDNEFQNENNTESLDYHEVTPGIIVENEGIVFTQPKETIGSQGSSSSQSSKKGDTDSQTGTLVTGNKSNAILVNPRQRGNPLLKSVTSVPWEYEEGVVPDYVLGRTTGALFLSLKYHNLKPEYINERIKQLGKLYQLRVLLVHVDMKDPHHSLKHLTRLCLLTDLTLMLAWSYEEAGKIIETYKAYEHKPPDLIMEKTESDPHVKLVSALTSVRSVNKTDAATLLTNFGSLERIIMASNHELCLCPGLGQQKATRLHTALHEPFLKGEKRQKLGIAKYFE